MILNFPAIPSSDLVALSFSPVSLFVTLSFDVLALIVFPLEVIMFVFLVVVVNAVPFLIDSFLALSFSFTLSTFTLFLTIDGASSTAFFRAVLTPAAFSITSASAVCGSSKLGAILQTSPRTAIDVVASATKLSKLFPAFVSASPKFFSISPIYY